MGKILTVMTVLCLVSVVCPYKAEAQKHSDAKANDNAVWYNARRGEPDAMNQVGIWYYTGNKVPRDYRQAYEWWSKGALAQSAKAIANLGVCYQYGRGTERDSVAAISLYLTAIQNGQQELFEQRQANTPNNTFDDMLIGLCYEKGIGTKQDYLKAAELYANAADRGSLDGVRAAADAYYRGMRPEKAIKYYEKAAVQGDMHSTYMAGKIQMRGTSSDRTKGIANITKAAEAGLPKAMTTMGAMYRSGDGVAASNKTAKQWFEKAAQAGDAEAMWQYGLMLKSESDFDNALYWLALASEAGYEDQLEHLFSRLPKTDPFRVYIDGMRRYYNGDLDGAAEAFKEVGKTKVNAGKVMEAVVYADKRNIKGSMSKASKILEKLAEDDSQAAYELGNIYWTGGDGVGKDTNQAISLYRKAANAGYGPAQDTLAGIYYIGQNTSIDRATAKELYTKAYKQRRLSTGGLTHLQSMTTDDDMRAKLSSYDAVDPVRSALSRF